MQVIKSDEREFDQGIKGVIWGKSGIGKTTLLTTLDPETTLVLDFEAGLLAAKGWGGDSIEIRNWGEAMAIAAVLGGADKSSPAGEAYSAEFVSRVREQMASEGLELDIEKYKTIFIDSITVASRLCLKWCKGHPDAFSKQGELSNLKLYGLLGNTMVNWLTQLQHVKGKNIWFVGILDEREDDTRGLIYEPQIEGSAASKKLAGIVDQIVTMAEVKFKSKDDIVTSKRAFITQTINKKGYPAKDRSGTLNEVEQAHLGNLMKKINEESRKEIDFEEILADEISW